MSSPSSPPPSPPSGQTGASSSSSPSRVRPYATPEEAKEAADVEKLRSLAAADGANFALLGYDTLAYRASLRNSKKRKQRKRIARELMRELGSTFTGKTTREDIYRLGQIAWDVNELGEAFRLNFDRAIRHHLFDVLDKASSVRLYLGVSPEHGYVPLVQANGALIKHLSRGTQAALIARTLNYKHSSVERAFANIEAFSDEAVAWVKEIMASTTACYSLHAPAKLTQHWLKRPESAADLVKLLTREQHLEIAKLLVYRHNPLNHPGQVWVTASKEATSAFVAAGDLLAVFDSFEWDHGRNTMRPYTHDAFLAGLCLKSVQARNGNITRSEGKELVALAITSIELIGDLIYANMPDTLSTLFFVANVGLVKEATKCALKYRLRTVDSYICGEFFLSVCRQPKRGRDIIFDLLEDKDVRYFLTTNNAPLRVQHVYNGLSHTYGRLRAWSPSCARRLAEVAARCGLSLERKYDKIAGQAPHLQEVHLTLPTFLLGLAPPASQEEEGEDESNHPLVNFAQHKTFDVNLLGVIASCLGGEGAQGGFLTRSSSSSSSFSSSSSSSSRSASSRPLKRSRVD